MPNRVLVNLGCGAVWHDAWRNYDLWPDSPAVMRIDLEQLLPFTERSVDAVYCSHVLEHLAPEIGQRLAEECFRVLKPGGRLRIVVPDLEDEVRRYLTALEDGDELEHEWAIIKLVDQMVRTRSEGTMGDFLRTQPWRNHPRIKECIGTEIGAAWRRQSRPRRRRLPTRFLARVRCAFVGMWLNRRKAALLEEVNFRAMGEVHRWMFDHRSLSRLLRGVGFAEISKMTATGSSIEGFAEFHLDVTETGQPRHPDSLYMEARKP